MAGEWIKWTKGLPRKSEVHRIAVSLGLTRAEVVVRLMQFWEWCDENIGNDAISDTGLASVQMSPSRGDNVSFIDDLVSTPGFAEALSSVNWLRALDGRIELPNFGRHNGETAKTRARNSKNQKNKRGNGESSEHHDKSGEPPPTTSEVSPPPGDKCHREPVTRGEESIEDANASSGGRKKRPRKRDALFDAIAEVTATDPVASGSFVGRVATNLRDGGFTPEEVREFARRFHELCWWAKRDGRARPELGELEKNIGKVRVKPHEPDPNAPKFDPMQGHTPMDFDAMRKPA